MGAFKSIDNKMIRIYGIVYGDKVTEYTRYENKFTEKLWRFENNPMIDISANLLHDLGDQDLVGVFSWKFHRKTGFTANQIMPLIHFKARPNVQVLNCSPHLGGHIHFMNWSDAGHIGIKRFVQLCCDHVGIEYNNDCEHVIYANQFVARKDIYQAYINKVIKPCLEFLEGPLWEEVNRPAGYRGALPTEKLKELTGLDFYNFVPFIMERMMMQFVSHYNLNTVRVI
jgi:hypothetical protein